MSIDVMVLYTQGMSQAYPSEQIKTRIQHLINLTNLAFVNSGISVNLRLVHSQQVNYPDDSAGGMAQALNELTANSGVFSGVEALRTAHGADQVTLLRRYVDEGCGRSWIITGAKPELAYTVVHDGRKADNSGYFCSEFTYAHEIGHNLGAKHDRSGTEASGSNNYAFGYQNPEKLFRTVMARNCVGGCSRIAYYSNPNVSYQGSVTGIDSSQKNSADNSKRINETRLFTSTYRVATK